jgi:hypothetical protein
MKYRVEERVRDKWLIVLDHLDYEDAVWTVGRFRDMDAGIYRVVEDI